MPVTPPDDAVERMARFVLRHGLAAATLRPLAKASATSDRMLIYRFGDKEGVISAILQRLSEHVQRGLNTIALDAGTHHSAEDLARDCITIMRQDAMAPYTSVWFELVATARGNPLHAQIGREIAEAYVAWLANRLPPDHPDPRDTALRVLAVVEGTLMLDALGMVGGEGIEPPTLSV